MSAADVLHRARLRLSAHGFHPGVSEKSQGRQARKGFLGYSLLEAVYGLDVSRETNESENQALGYLEQAIGLLHPETPTIVGFNAAPGRTKAQVQNVITRAINLAKRGPRTDPVPQNDETPAESEAVSSTPESRAAQTFHPLDHDKDGHKGGSLPSPQRETAALIAEAEALGIEVDRRWGVQKLLDEIHDAKAKQAPLPLPNLGPTPVAPDLAASDGMEGIVQAGQRPPLTLVNTAERSDFFLRQTKPAPEGDAS